MYTITKQTRTGILEFLTVDGFRSENAMVLNNLKPLKFEKIEGSKKVIELRKKCRLPEIRRTIILNY